MMKAKLRGADEMKDFLATLPDKLRRKVLRGGLHAASAVIRKEARVQASAISPKLAKGIKVSSRVRGDTISAKVKATGEFAYLSRWIEYGTAAHTITAYGARTVRGKTPTSGARVLKIGDRFVGASVEHPGVRPRPFLRTAADTRLREATGAYAEYINTRLNKEGLSGPDFGLEDQED